MLVAFGGDHRCQGHDVPMSVVVKLAREIYELVSDVGGYGMVSKIMSSRDKL